MSALSTSSLSVITVTSYRCKMWLPCLFYLLWHPKVRQYIGELREPLVRTLMVEDMWLCAMIETPRN